METLGAKVMGERSRSLAAIRWKPSGLYPSPSSPASAAASMDVPHWSSPKVAPISDVPYMLRRLMQGAPTTAAVKREVCPTVQLVIYPP